MPKYTGAPDHAVSGGCNYSGGVQGREGQTGCTAGWHDTVYAYRRRGCRCPNAIAAMQAAYRERRPCSPYKDYDPVVVQRVIDGEPPARLTWPERIEAVRQLVAHGYSDRQVALRIHSTAGAVCKTRLRHGIAAATPRPGSTGKAKTA